jgi:ribosomal protein S18 acetylase RimI-like enzyme
MGQEREDIGIEKLTPERLDHLVKVQEEAFSDYIIPIKSSKEFFLDFQRSVGGDLSTVLLASDAGKIVGYINPVIDGKEAWIGGIGVIPQYRSSGVGTKLMRSAEELCRNRGVQSITLEVIEGNDRAQRMYERQGFSVTRKFLSAEGKPIRFEGFGPQPKVASFSEVLYLHEKSYMNTCWQRRKRAAVIQSAKGAESYKVDGGFVMIRAVQTSGFIPFLGVFPEARRRGIGTALAKYALTKLWDAGVFKVALYNVNEDPQTQRMLDEFDFKVTMKQIEMKKEL